ncbi:MAG: hypothetical protein M1816_003674 [Peltula sp. TS41687]|nr:MAG: hypothetical protein M1816_003674 [Peltula sp. TS41687]
MVADERAPLLQERHASFESAPADKNEKKSSWSQLLSIVVVLFGVFLANADDSFVIATYDTIASHYQQVSDAPWLLTAYNLGYLVALPVVSGPFSFDLPLQMHLGGTEGPRGKITPICERERSYRGPGMGFSLWQVVFGRVTAGIGGAGMIAMVSVIVTDIVPIERVAVVRGYVNAVGIAGRSLGGPAGGFLADTVGWKWSFLGQAPIALLCLFLTAWQLPSESPKPGKAHGDGPHSVISKLRDMDFLGIAIFTAATVNFLVVLNLGGEKLPWDHPVIISLVISCLVLFTAFLYTERFLANRPLIPLWLLKVNGVGLLCLVQVLVFLSKAATLSNVAPYFIRTQNASNTVAANYLLLPYIIYALAALGAGYIISRYKKLTLGAVAIAILAHLLVTLRWRHGTNIWEAQYVVLVGVGFGVVLATQFLALTASAPKAQLATAIGMYYLSQQFGEILGVSIAATILRIDFRNTLRRRLGDRPDAERIIDGAINDTGFAATLPKAIQATVRSSYLHSFQFAPLVSTCGYTLVGAIIVYLREQPLR